MIKLRVGQPAIRGPGPVSADGIDDAGHDETEDDVAIEVAPLSDGSGHDGRTGGCKGALEEHEGKVLKSHVNQGKVRVSNERCSLAKGQSIANNQKCSNACI